MIDRLAATRLLAERLTDQLVVTGLGNVAFDLYALADRPLNFYTWGAMGTATSLGLGLAIARPDRQVVVLEGDGSLLMNLGSLATIGRYAPPNLVCCIWDNGAFQITGGQEIATGAGSADLAAVARGCGIEQAELVADEASLTRSIDLALRNSGPSVVVARVDRTITDAYLPRKPVLIKERFMHAAGSLPERDRLVWSGRPAASANGS